MGTYTVDLGPEDRELAAHAFAPSSASRLRSLKRVYDPGSLRTACRWRRKERKKTANQGRDDGTPPPHRDFKERSVMR